MISKKKKLYHFGGLQVSKINLSLESNQNILGNNKNPLAVYAAYDNTSSLTSPDGRQLSFDTSPSSGHNDYTNPSVADPGSSDSGLYTRPTDASPGGSDP